MFEVRTPRTSAPDGGNGWAISGSDLCAFGYRVSSVPVFRLPHEPRFDAFGSDERE